MSILKSTQLSKSTQPFVAKSRARINNFVMEVSSMIEKECCMAMLHNNIDIYSLMVYAQQIEESSLGRLLQIERGIDRMNQVNLSLKRGSIIKTIPSQTRIVFQPKFSRSL